MGFYRFYHPSVRAQTARILCLATKNPLEQQSWNEGKNGTGRVKLARFAQNSHSALEKRVLHVAKPVFLVSDFSKIEKANAIRFKGNRASSKYVYGEFRKTGVREVGVKYFYSVHKSKGV